MARTISICIPVFNEEDNVVTAVESVERVFAESLPDYELELIITDNASSDRSWERIQELCNSRPRARAYRFSRNFGYQASVFAGLSLATGDAAIELDADLEDPPEVIPKLIAKWEEGYDVAYGLRTRRHGSRIRRFLAWTFYRVLRRLSDVPIAPDSGDFRLISRPVLEVLKGFPERSLYIRGLVSFSGFRQIAVPYERNPRLAGTSKFRLGHYLGFAWDAITAFSTKPLRVTGAIGMLLFVSMVMLGAFYVVKQLVYGTPIPGFTTLVVLMLLLHGLTFVFLGIMGEYVSRIADDVKNRPRVVIEKSINDETPPRYL